MITILMGKSSSGKDTLLNELKEYDFKPLISTTSRPMRDGETEGVQYHFTSNEDFENRLAKGDFLEHRAYKTEVDGKPVTWYYGCPKCDLEKDVDYVVILDVEGAEKFLEYYGRENCFVVELDCPPLKSMERAMARENIVADNSPEYFKWQSEWENRRKKDDKDFREELTKEVANYTMHTGGLDVEEMTNDFLEVYNAYYSHEKEEGKQYLCFLNLINGTYYEPPYWETYVIERGEYERLQEAERLAEDEYNEWAENEWNEWLGKE